MATAQVTYDASILGPGDGLQIELLDLPELSGRFSIGPDGTRYLPRLRALDVEGLTVVYRPIRIDVGGKPAITAIEEQAHQLLNCSATC